MKLKFICTASLIFLLCSCFTPRIMTSDQDSVSFYVKAGLLTDNLDEAQSFANEHCQKYNKIATLREVEEISRVPPKTLAIKNISKPI